MLTRQPNSLHCFVCGVENPFGLHVHFYNGEPGEVVAEIRLPEQYQGYPGVVHGGVIAALLDEAAGRTQMGDDPPRFMYTARLEVRYRRNVPVDQPLKLVGKAGESHGRKSYATSAIYNMEGTLLAEADALMIDVPAEVVDTTDLEAIGWKVYEDGPERGETASPKDGSQ